MKRLIQKMNYTTVLPYNGEGFDYLDGEMKFNSDDKPYIYYKFYLTDSAKSYLDETVIDPLSFVDDNVISIAEVSIYEDNIEIYHPYIPSDDWVVVANKNIINTLENTFDNFSYDGDIPTVTTKSTFRYNSPHPHFGPYDILTLFNESLYNFDSDNYSADELNDIGIHTDMGSKVYFLKDAFDNKTGIYYIPDYDLFHFDAKNHNTSTEKLCRRFEKMIYDIMALNSPLEYFINPHKKIIDTGALVPWLYWHGYPAVEFWNYIQDYICLRDNSLYYQDKCFNYVREHTDNVTTLHLKRIEADLLDILSYEYPVYNINRKSMIEKLSIQYNKNVDKILWENGPGFRDTLDKFADKNIPHTAFSYDQDIGYKGDILYYESKKLPVKIAVQLKRYTSIIPTNEDIDIQKSLEVSPFGWYAKLIGVKKLDETLTQKDIESKLNPDGYYIMYNSVFKDASQLLYRELDEELDILFNEPDMSAWD